MTVSINRHLNRRMSQLFLHVGEAFSPHDEKTGITMPQSVKGEAS